MSALCAHRRCFISRLASAALNIPLTASRTATEEEVRDENEKHCEVPRGHTGALIRCSLHAPSARAKSLHHWVLIPTAGPCAACQPSPSPSPFFLSSPSLLSCVYHIKVIRSFNCFHSHFLLSAVVAFIHRFGIPNLQISEKNIVSGA